MDFNAYFLELLVKERQAELRAEAARSELFCSLSAMHWIEIGRRIVGQIPADAWAPDREVLQP